jgi:hypothetical protein
MDKILAKLIEQRDRYQKMLDRCTEKSNPATMLNFRAQIDHLNAVIIKINQLKAK